jgi:predicted dehydrogenase
MIKLGVIGYGYWGPNIVRNFAGHQDCKVVAVCDKNSVALARVLGRHPESA